MVMVKELWCTQVASELGYDDYYGPYDAPQNRTFSLCLGEVDVLFHYEDLKLSPSQAAEKAVSRYPQLMSRERRMEEALKALAARGIHTDLTPTTVDTPHDELWWFRYLEEADEKVRQIARAALAS